jgi:hypothetical protein
MFSQLRTKLTSAVQNVQDAVAPLSDPSQQRIQNLCEAATSENLTTPDWALNLELVDAVNNDPT